MANYTLPLHAVMKSLFKDLPEAKKAGRDHGSKKPTVKKARVAKASVSAKEMRQTLDFMKDEVSAAGLTGLVSKYKCLPEVYYREVLPMKPEKLRKRRHEWQD